MTEITTETTVDTVKAKAIQFVNTHSMADIIDALADTERSLNASKEANRLTRARLQELVDTVTEFIKENYKDGATADQLKELANDLDIELTKELTVTFTVSYEATLIVPLEFTYDDIDSGDFDASVRFVGHGDVEVNDEQTDIEDFEVEEA